MALETKDCFGGVWEVTSCQPI